MSIKINTLEVDTYARNISSINKSISSDFLLLEQSIKNLNTYWDGTASENAISKFNTIKNTFYMTRYNTINSMVCFMRQFVSAEYDKTETTIQSAAKSFK